MVMVKKHSSKQGLFSKVTNILLIALGFSRPLFLAFRPGGFSPGSLNQIITEATFGLSAGKFDLAAGLRTYSPGGAAVALGTLKQYLMRKFPVR